MDRDRFIGGVGADHVVVNRLMLKFRPIAPKPVNGKTLVADSEVSDAKSLKVGEKLPKRKYVRSRKNNIKRSPSRKRMGRLSRQKKGDHDFPIEEKEKEEEGMDMLRLLPDKFGDECEVDTGILSLPSSTVNVTGQEKAPPLIPKNSIKGIFDGSDIQLSLEGHCSISPQEPVSFHCSNRVMNDRSPHLGLHLPDQHPSCVCSDDFINLKCQLLSNTPDEPVMTRDPEGLEPRVVAVVETVSMDCQASADPGELGGSDSEIVKNIGLDTSPGFISDTSGKIRWLNGAFRKLVTAVGGHQCRIPLLPVESVTILAMKHELPGWCRAFSGQVRVKLQQESRCGAVLNNLLSDHKGNCKWQQVMPCDVWRMERGGFAWRLDLEAALTLGR